MNIRGASEADLPVILDIMNDAILNTTAIYDYNSRTEDQVHAWYDSKKDAGFPVLVATEGAEVLGYASYGAFRTWDGYRYSVEHSVYVDKRARGKGIGKALLLKLIEVARENNYHTMIAGIDAANPSSIGLHKGLGFQEVGMLKEVGFKFDRWLDLVFMQLLLT